MKKIAFRIVTDDTILNIVAHLDDTNWDTLESLDIDDAYKSFIDTVIGALDIYAPVETKTIQSKNIIRQPWMSSGLLTSARTCDKMYRKCLGRSKTCGPYQKYIAYRNNFHKLKRFAKQNYYANELSKYQNDVKKTWNLLNTITGRVKGTRTLSGVFKIRNENIREPQIITNE